ncbi:MAG: HAD-IA family hydrolase, partial [Pelagibacteraceae bacterium]
IYILSNFPGDQFEKYRRNNNYIDQFDDRIISGNVSLAKPDKSIYELAIKKFNLIPEESLFIDDKIENTKSAELLGIKTIHLDKPNNLNQLIKKFVNF